MNYIQFFDMRPEVALLAVYLILFMYDLVSAGRYRRLFHPLACMLATAMVAVTLSDRSTFTLFGGMYESNAMIVFMKAVLAFGSLLAILQAHKWLRSEHTSSLVWPQINDSDVVSIAINMSNLLLIVVFSVAPTRQ